MVPTTSFDGDLTKAMLKRCKAQGVSISSTIFAICNIAWARMTPREKQELPMWGFFFIITLSWQHVLMH